MNNKLTLIMIVSMFSSVVFSQSQNSFSLGINYDDGAIIYLNGTEVVRGNMPAGTVSFSTFASTYIPPAGENNFANEDLLSRNNLLVFGKNVIAVEVHQGWAGSSDLSFDLRLQGDSTLISEGSIWKYFDKGSLPDSQWFGMNFSDSSWDSGRAELGYGDGDEATVVSFGPNSSNKYTTTYFRQSFYLGYGGVSITNPVLTSRNADHQLSFVSRIGSFYYLDLGSLGNHSKNPVQIFLSNIHGQKIWDYKSANHRSRTSMRIPTYQNGVFVISAFYDDKTISQRFVTLK